MTELIHHPLRIIKIEQINTLIGLLNWKTTEQQKNIHGLLKEVATRRCQNPMWGQDKHMNDEWSTAILCVWFSPDGRDVRTSSRISLIDDELFILPTCILEIMNQHSNYSKSMCKPSMQFQFDIYTHTHTHTELDLG